MAVLTPAQANVPIVGDWDCNAGETPGLFRQDSPSDTNPLAAVLNLDGSIKPGANGSFDARGFSMKYGPNGEPRFKRAVLACGTPDWDPQFGVANGTNGSVYALAVIGNAIYVGGIFTATRHAPANNVAKFDTTTNTWSALSQGNGNGVDGFVFALAVSGDSLFVGGAITTANQGGTGATPAIPANAVARFDTTTNTWSALAQGNGNGVSSSVTSLGVIGNSLFVGGFFSTANSGGTGATSVINANRVAKFDTTTNTWSALTSQVNPNANGVDNAVFALVVNGNIIYVGGAFTNANDDGGGGGARINANRVAKFDTTTNTWSALSQGNGNGVTSGGAIGLNNRVRALAVSSNNLFVGGIFTTANLGGTGGTPAINANNVAKFDTTGNIWSALAGSGGSNGVHGQPGGSTAVDVLAMKDCDLFVGGDFFAADNKVSQNIGRYGGTGDAVLDIDGSLNATKYDALTHGLLVLRYLFGLTGTSLTNGALGGTATRTDPAVIKAYLDGIRASLDVDGNGTSDALTDGLLILRYLFGLRGSSLIAGAVATGAPRATAALIEAYIQSLSP